MESYTLVVRKLYFLESVEPGHSFKLRCWLSDSGNSIVDWCLGVAAAGLGVVSSAAASTGTGVSAFAISAGATGVCGLGLTFAVYAFTVGACACLGSCLFHLI